MPRDHSSVVQLHCEEAGSGFPVVLLHAFPCDYAIWSLQVPVVSEKFRVLVPDLRGFGRSEKPSRGYTASDFSRDVKALLERKGIEKAFLVGLSLGGSVALRFALDYPEMTQGSVMIGSFGPMERESTFRVDGAKPGESLANSYITEVAAGYLNFWNKVWKPNIELLFHKNFSSTPFGSSFIRYLFEERYARLNTNPAQLARVVEECSDSFWGEPIFSGLAAVETPVQIVAGSDDTCMKYCQEAHRMCPESEFRMIRNSGHFCNIDGFEEFNTTLMTFLLKHSPHHNQ